MKVESEYGDVLEALKNAEPAGEPDGLAERATGTARGDTPPRPPWGAFEEHADELYRYLSALVQGDSWLAEHVLGEAFARVGDKSEPTFPELIQSGRHAALESLAKSGPTAGEQGPLSHGDRALVLERRMGLSMKDLTRIWSQMPSRLTERLEACSAHLLHHLEQQADAPAPACAEWRPRLGHALLDLLEEQGAEAYAEHRTECPACAQWIELLEETMTPPAKSLPAPDKTRQRLEERILSSHVLPIDLGIQVSVSCCYCHDGMQRKEAAFCATCMAPHHPDCFQQHGRCATPACEGVDVIYPQAAGGQRPKRRRGWIGPAIGVVGVVLGAAAFTSVKSAANREEAVVERARVAELELEQLRVLQERYLAQRAAEDRARAQGDEEALRLAEEDLALKRARANAELAELEQAMERALSDGELRRHSALVAQRRAALLRLMGTERGQEAAAKTPSERPRYPEASPIHRPLNLAETETTKFPAGTFTVAQFMSHWAKENGRVVTVDPGYASGHNGKVMGFETVIKLDAPQKLTRVQLRALLDTVEGVLVIGKENTAAVHWKRTLASKLGNDAPLVEGQAAVDPDAYVSRVITIEHGGGQAIFATVRGLLTRDVNRIGNILYSQIHNQITIIDLARKIHYYEEMAIKLDVPVELPEPAPTPKPRADAEPALPLLTLAKTETTKAPAGVHTVPYLVELWSKQHGKATSVDPQLRTVQVTVPGEKGSEQTLSRTQLRAVLEPHDAILVVGAEDTASVWHRRNLAQKVQDPVLISDDTAVDPDSFVSRIVPVRHGNGNTIFASVRGLLTRDVNRIGNILYSQDPEQITIVDLARKVRSYEQVVAELDAPSQRKGARAEVFRIAAGPWNELRKLPAEEVLTKLRKLDTVALIESTDLDFSRMNFPAKGSKTLSKRAVKVEVPTSKTSVRVERHEVELRVERSGSMGPVTLTLGIESKGELQLAAPRTKDEPRFTATLLDDGTFLVFAVSPQ